jgi:class 3 adenylate cyclase
MATETTPNDAPPLERRLATILSADIAGYSQMMGVNEERTVRVFRGHREIFESLVKLHRGRIFNTAGDALLAEFNSAVEAVRCATEIQAALRTRNEHLAPEEKMLFRMGINLGDVIVQGGDLLGDGVNVASRIQTSTEPGGICISGSVHDQIQNKLSLDFKLLGEQIFKNIAKPVRTYTINEGAAVTAPAPRPWSKVPAAIAAAVVAIAGAGYLGYQQYEARRAEQARIESELSAQLAVQKKATEQAQRATEDAKRDAQLQAQRQAAEETLRRAQEERKRLEQDRKLLEIEKRTADAAKKQAEASQRTVPPAAPVAQQTTTAFDGTYGGQLCNQWTKPPNCWPVGLIVRNGIAEGKWPSPTGKPSKATGRVATNGTFELNLSGWSRDEKPIEAALAGRAADGGITASGQWRGGFAIAGNWKRTQVAAATPTATVAPKSAALYDGTYNGQLCSQWTKPPECWPVALVVRNGIAAGSWISRTQKTARARGTVAVDGAVQMNLATWTVSGTPTEAVLLGRIVDGAITASGKWREGGAVSGNWKRAR